MSQPYANLLGALKEGYFSKCGDRHKSWKVRWFVLTKDILYYFDKEISTEPLGIIPLKDYQRCKGMEGDAYRATGKQNSFYLQTPYRMYKCFCNDWKSSELWAESIAALGEFLKKKEDIRKPTKYQQEVLRLVNDAICFASSLTHWYKLVVDSTPSYKNGIHSIYAAAIYDIPRDLGAQTIELARVAILAVNAPYSPAQLEQLKMQASKVMAQVIRAEGFVVCCAETHKVKFNADLEVLRKSVKAIEEMRPMFPVNEIIEASVALCKTAYAVCKLFVREEIILVAEPVKPRTSSIPLPPPPPGASAAASPRPLNSRSQISNDSAPAAQEPATPAMLLADYKNLARIVAGHLDLLRSRPMFPGEQGQIQLVQGCMTKLEAATTELVTLLQQGVPNPPQINALYNDLPANCRELMATSEKLYVDRV
jgi:hypothetical protein